MRWWLRRMPRLRRVRRLPWLRRRRVRWLPRLRRRLPWLGLWGWAFFWWLLWGAGVARVRGWRGLLRILGSVPLVLGPREKRDCDGRRITSGLPQQSDSVGRHFAKVH